ncbi:M14 family metallopeptidase [Belliella kenyensis]|uniref:M14 family metallopeptidase n=1 Tax=Belliella kenyensis TaxID=1472724 RepID=A0ABV8EII7_9BACT|nr:M14 family metallopeptidase [Belliella kenyensis]MCH7401241.1 M14 family metallopeptidase [Belliella kenyensis]MDN3602687.1 M14 family metallopeptidase [Belliella kenyensis]
MKKIYLSLVAGIGLLCTHTATTMAQGEYPTLSQVNQRLQAISGSGSPAKLTSLTKTEGGKDIWVLKVGKGDMDNKPGIAVVGGVEGFHVLSVELALQFAEKLVREHADKLEQTTFYVFPNMSPDAYEQYHASLKYERRGNAVKVDHDRDGQVSEDGYEDLNKDGFITMMRVESPMGDYITLENDDRVLIKSDRSKGQRGSYMLLPESRDKDKDGKFGEDLAEGIAFNKSLTYKFPIFEPLAGDFAVSQVESRALLDYLFEQWNIFSIVTFSPANNLSTPLKHNAGDARKRVLTTILNKDAAINSMVSGIYNETVSQKAHNQNNQGTDGDFFQWAYFHFGRLSFSTPGWWIPEVKDADGKAISNPQANFLAWAEQEGINDVFVPWTVVDHPDFPGQKVEVGGIKPFVMHNPPFSKVAEIADEHTSFILKLADLQPKLEFHNVKTEKLGNGLTRITADLFNNSPLPTHAELGERSRWLRKIRIDISKDKKDLVAGEKIQLIKSVGAFEKTTLSWVVKGSGSVEIKAGAAHAGFATLNVKL